MIPKQFRIHMVLIVACLFMILFPLMSEKPDAGKVEQAAPVAMAFLQLIDAGEYAESWQSSAALMREKVSEADWVEKLNKARSLSGRLVQRARKDASYSTKAKDSPEGEYIMFTFNSKFKAAEDVSEYVTVMWAEEGWQVAGYFMQ